MRTPIASAFLLMTLAAAAPASAASVDAGSLRAQASDGRFELRFADGHGRHVLSQDPRTTAGPAGTLGFRVGATWRHATRVLTARRVGRAWEGRLATTDPSGRTLRVRLEPDREGVIALHAELGGDPAGVTALGIGFRGRRGERYLGFGERSDAVGRRAGTVETYVAEGPYQTSEWSLISNFVPSWGVRERSDASYFPMPWLLSSDGYGVLVDSTFTTYHRLGRDGTWSVEVTAAPTGVAAGAAPSSLDLRVFAGPRPADVVRRLSAAVGRQPDTKAPWLLGPWIQPPDGDAAMIDRLRARDVPSSVAQTYLHYLPCGDQQGQRAAQRDRTQRFHDAGMAVTTYVNPMVCVGYRDRYDQAAAGHGLTRDQTGAPYVYRYSTASRFQVSQFDLASGAGRDAFGGVLGEALADGYDGWMEDFGEYTPLDSVSAAGRSGAEVHNRYPVEYHCAAQDAAPRAGRFVRSGFTGSARCSPVVWGGDPTSAWGFDGLRSAVTNGLTMGLSGVGLWGSDIGGFFALGNNALSPELLTRWVELGFASGVMRTEADGIAVPAKPRPQVTDDGQLATWRRYAKLRTQLYPYLDAALAEYRRTGMPLMRHLALVAPADRRALATDDEFLLGPDLLVAPVLDQGARSRRAYLPRGRWIDLWRSARWDDRAGTLRLGRTRVLSGGRTVRVPAPLEQLPLLVRAGAVLPLTSDDVDTLAPFGRGVVRLSDRADRLRLLAFPAARTQAAFPAGRATSTVAGGRWTLRLHDGRRRTYAVEAGLGASGLRRGRCRVTGATSWRYDRARRVLRATVVGRGGRLTARGC